MSQNSQTPSSQCSRTSTDEKYIIAIKVHTTFGHLILKFCNQYEDDRILYVYNSIRKDFYIVHRFTKKNYDDNNLSITLDQWTKFIKVVRLLSAAVISRFPEDRKDTDVLSMPTHPTDNEWIYSIEKDNNKGIVQVILQKSATTFAKSPFSIPFNPELNEAILTYRKRISTEIDKMTYPDSTPL